MAGDDAPVIIVGGSLVGLSTALFLGHHGVPSLVLERHRGTAIHPRAAMVTQRTIEAYRAVGIEAEVEDAAAKEFVQNGAIMSVESLGGKELQWWFREINEGVETISPSKRLFVTQIGLEPVLLRHAERLGARIEYSSEATSVEQDADGVSVVVRPRDGGPERTVRGRYLVACDGAHSPIRERLGIEMLGHGSFSDSITIYFRADVRHLMGDRNLSVIYVFGPRVQGFFRFSLDQQEGFLVVNSTSDEQGNRSVNIGEDMSDETCIDYVREALGDPDIAVEVENVQRWSATAAYAERLRDGRIFLAGDAVHVMPPTGGFGGNTGVQDAYDIAWKLAYVLDGRAGEGLLDSYEAERSPIDAATTEQAYSRYVMRLDQSLGMEGLAPIAEEGALEVGYRYRSAVLADEGGDEPWEDPRQPSGKPGIRAPHVELADGTSSIDLFGRNFVVVTGSDGAAWEQAAAAAGGELGVTVETHRIAELEDALGIGSAGASLVRPDGFVAWRATSAAGDPAAELTAALRTALAR